MRKIRQVAVLGAGVMGATIAAHLANAGLGVLLLDIVPDDVKEDPKDRNRFARKGLKDIEKMKPAAFFLKKYASRITPGNFEDDMPSLKNCDWIIEVVIENMAIKKQLFQEKIVPNLADGAILSSNTSGLSINELAEVLPGHVQKNFLATHFFNPPRYMRLLEIIPCQQSDPNMIKDISDFIASRLGKGIVYGKDTANFIANRVGVFSMYNTFKHMMEMDLTVEQVDAVVGTATGKPRSAAFRTADLVGLDTMVHVGTNSYDAAPDDEARDTFIAPDFIKGMIEKGLLGNKTKQGFYRKEMIDGKRQIYYYDYKTGDYKPLEKPKFGSVAAVKQVDDPAQRLKMVLSAKDTAAELAWKTTRDSLIYAFNRIPEISDDIVNIDAAMKLGFNWDLGPFEIFDVIGVEKFVKLAEKDGVAVPEALTGIESFYQFKDGKQYFYDLKSNDYLEIPVKEGQIKLEILKKAQGVMEKNSNSSLIDLGDGVFGLEFHSKMNALGGDILSLTRKAIKRAEKEGVGLVIGNQGSHFSAGANLMLLAIAIAEGSYDDIGLMLKSFQNTTMAIKYADVPVVVAPFNLTLGGGCEFSMAADARVAHAETYMGLVEMGVGLLPAGGGTKESTIRAVELAESFKTDVSAFLFKRFENIGLAKVSMSADEAFELGYMREGDSITMNIDNLIHDAKQKILGLAPNYRPSKPLTAIKAPGRGVAASIKSQLWNLAKGAFATEYEAYMGGIVADVICGGDVPAGTLITEEYLLKLEREGFLKLCGNKKTLERIQHMLKKGKPLRN
ncbi:MAG: 3-hydroxyacyl-CoA dehydrogenase [Deltaproteobacteria bacterium]|jgi:3-hydroxyacyl-CoA dehydrogenase|nr:3-hydroxyacyl-CoA dehydrogenase [Deltaproteobacteria bacterium]